jgi:polyisoprenoid-binding protein YceI
MSSLAVQPFTGTFHAQPGASTFAFAVRHSGVFWYRGTVPDVTATLTGGGAGGALTLEGAARIDSISIAEPEAMRANVLGAAFFDAERHPELTFRSTAIRLADDGRAEVDGELTLRGTTRAVTATGSCAPPRASDFGEIAGLQLSTTLDRRAFGFAWQSQLPDGGDAVGWEVQIDVDLLLIRGDDDADQ